MKFFNILRYLNILNSECIHKYNIKSSSQRLIKKIKKTANSNKAWFPLSGN